MKNREAQIPNHHQTDALPEQIRQNGPENNAPVSEAFPALAAALFGGVLPRVASDRLTEGLSLIGNQRILKAREQADRERENVRRFALAAEDSTVRIVRLFADDGRTLQEDENQINHLPDMANQLDIPDAEPVPNWSGYAGRLTAGAAEPLFTEGVPGGAE